MIIRARFWELMNYDELCCELWQLISDGGDEQISFDGRSLKILPSAKSRVFHAWHVFHSIHLNHNITITMELFEQIISKLYT